MGAYNEIHILRKKKQPSGEVYEGASTPKERRGTLRKGSVSGVENQDILVAIVQIKGHQ